MQHYGKTMEHAIACGDLLAKAKADVPHGQWLPWLRQNIDFSERTSQGYMRLARSPQRVAGLGVRQGLGKLASPRRDWWTDVNKALAEWLERNSTLNANRPANPADWSIEDAKARVDIIKECERIFHRFGICHEEYCMVCAGEIAP